MDRVIVSVTDLKRWGWGVDPRVLTSKTSRPRRRAPNPPHITMILLALFSLPILPDLPFPGAFLQLQS